MSQAQAGSATDSGVFISVLGGKNRRWSNTIVGHSADTVVPAWRVTDSLEHNASGNAERTEQPPISSVREVGLLCWAAFE